MREFEVDIDTLKGASLEAGSLFVLKRAIYARSLDSHVPSALVSPKLKAHKDAIEFEKASLLIDRRLKRAVNLLVENLEIENK